MTCNPKWPEIRRFVKDTGLNPEDRSDILCRLFKIKLDALIKELKENEFSWQNSSRRADGRFIEKSCVKLDNRNVVPYNKHLLKRYQAHINVEWCNQSSSIKYLFKYINKGPDRATVAIVENSNDAVTFNVVDEIKQPSVASSMFLAWMHCNQIYQEERELTYVEFPTKFVWKLDEQRWDRRKKGFSIGRIHSVSPTVREEYYLRILLNKVKGPKSFEDIRTVNGKTFLSFRDACYAVGLLDDDKEYIDAIEEANLTASDLSLNEEQVNNLTLFEIEKILLRNNSTLKNFTTLPYLDNDSLESSKNRMIAEEMDYNHHNLRDEFQTLVTTLTNEQRGVYNEIMIAVEKKKGGVFFVYGNGGTGKTFLWKTLDASIRSKGDIVLNVASSGIASLLLTGGRTAHYRFQIPLILNEDSLCHMKPDSDVASLIKKTTLIIWDEAPMVHKHAFEALDRSMNDIFHTQRSGDSHMLFGGKVTIFGGDFRQILPVIPNAGRQDIVNASLSSSYIWKKSKVLRLIRNMRLTANSESSEIEQTRDFAKWILDLGEGKVGGEENEYLSSDTLCESEHLHDEFDKTLYSPDVLNGLKLSEIPNHKILLKVGVPVMLLRNIDQKSRLCNDTRLRVLTLGNRMSSPSRRSERTARPISEEREESSANPSTYASRSRGHGKGRGRGQGRSQIFERSQAEIRPDQRYYQWPSYSVNEFYVREVTELEYGFGDIGFGVGSSSKSTVPVVEGFSFFTLISCVTLFLILPMYAFGTHRRTFFMVFAFTYLWDSYGILMGSASVFQPDVA
ncbi:uncharacterized protein LOC112514142 [Cynara cardunculus var. scolymus]|uniref:uncharacterized protein LOC112514142 n=1 Tax=Cynara cardunculus var. scolymus TaxID=59895 RepID=UPI000D624625|nr:uncharacterized protein LOC112514142 [Cynara cardunculus var. scolymus]